MTRRWWASGKWARRRSRFVVPTGLVEVSAPGLAPRTGTLDAQGRTSIELPANVHSWNRAKVVVTYLGSSDVLPSKVSFRTLGRR